MKCAISLTEFQENVITTNQMIYVLSNDIHEIIISAATCTDKAVDIKLMNCREMKCLFGICEAVVDEIFNKEVTVSWIWLSNYGT